MNITNEKGIVAIDLTAMPQETNYEDRYQQYMTVFKTIALIPRNNAVTIVVTDAPYSWHPLLRYLDCELRGGQCYFEHDNVVKQMTHYIDAHDRTATEVMCGFRPECTDALWKCDMQWQTNRPQILHKQDFIVTNNGSFHRPEVLRFMKKLDTYTSKAKGCVVVPCAADKPYPAPLHKKVREMMPDAWDLCIATGVLGIVPEAMWDDMPYYDSGVPNEWRLMNRAIDFFMRNEYQHVIFYVDFYSLALSKAAEFLNRRRLVNTVFIYVNTVAQYDDYLNLLDVSRLTDLQEEIKWVCDTTEQETPDAISN